MPIMPWWANDQDAAHLQAKTVHIHLILNELAQYLLSSGFCEIPGAFIMPLGMPTTPPWANDQDVAYLQAKMVPENLIWSESTQWLLSSGVRNIPGAFIMPMGMPILPPWANDLVAHLKAKTSPAGGMSALQNNAYLSMLFVMFCSISVSVWMSVSVLSCPVPLVVIYLLSVRFALALLQYNIWFERSCLLSPFQLCCCVG